jgi:hypothetical protein
MLRRRATHLGAAEMGPTETAPERIDLKRLMPTHSATGPDPCFQSDVLESLGACS